MRTVWAGGAAAVAIAGAVGLLMAGRAHSQNDDPTLPTAPTVGVPS